METKADHEGGLAAAAWIPLAYEELRRLARRRMGRLKAGETFTPTDLVNEVLLRLLKQPDRKFKSSDHMVRVAALAMHNVLADLARRRSAAKRSGHRKRVDYDEDLPIAAPADDMIRFHEACEVLRGDSEEHFELVLLRVYAGLSIEEIAQQRKQSTRTVERQWKLVKAILAAKMGRTRKSAGLTKRGSKGNANGDA